MTTDYSVDEAMADAIRWAEDGAPYPPGARAGFVRRLGLLEGRDRLGAKASR